MGWDHAKTAVIIGAASRVGRAIAVEIARRGFEVGIVDYGMDDARKTLDIVKGEGGSGELFRCDMGDANQAEAMAAHFFSAWGEVGLLVNNTGIDDCGRCAGDIPVDEWKLAIVEGDSVVINVHVCLDTGKLVACYLTVNGTLIDLRPRSPK